MTSLRCLKRRFATKVGKQLLNHTVYLRLHHPKHRSTIHVLGTEHNKRECAEEVYDMIMHTKPHQVVIELCEDRLKIARANLAQNLKHSHNESDMVQGVRAADELGVPMILADKKRKWVMLRVVLAGLQDMFTNIAGKARASSSSLSDETTISEFLAEKRKRNDDNVELSTRIGETTTMEELRKATSVHHQTMEEFSRAHHILTTEREIGFVRALREASGPVVVAIFGKVHLPSIEDLWRQHS